MQEGFRRMRERESGLVCGNANDRRRDASDLMGYKYEGGYHVWIPQIGVRDNTYSL